MERISALRRPRRWWHSWKRCILLDNRRRATLRRASCKALRRPRPAPVIPRIEMNAEALGILQSWSAPIGLDIALAVAVLVYARGWIRLRSAFPGLISQRRLG